MKNYPHILSYLALSLLAACGGGGGGGSPSTASSDTNQPKIECNAECQAGREAERKAAEEAEKAKVEAERKAAEEAEKARVETERKAAEEAEKAKAQAERKAAEKAKAEAERKAAEEAEKAKAEAERKAAEEAEKAKAEAERKAAEEAAKAKAEAERKAAEEAEKAKVEAERKAAEEAEKAKVEAERKATEEAAKAKAEAERKAAEEAEKAKAEAERKAAEEAEKAKAEAERKAAEEAEKAKAEAERKAAEAAAPQQIDGYYSKISQSGMEGDDISHIGDINILEVDGQKISLVPVSPQRDEVFGIEDDEHKFSLVAATHLKYGRYGSYGLRNENGDIHTSYMFYQGVITPEAAMPQEGQAFYRGYALYSDVGQANTFGNSIFMVDFGRKSLSGAVYSENGEFDEVNLEGQIVGNRFFHVDEKEQKIMSGMFLGPQAEELTGRFDHLLESKNGTFGAAALKE